jgi:hypothetical protein
VDGGDKVYVVEARLAADEGRMRGKEGTERSGSWVAKKERRKPVLIGVARFRGEASVRSIPRVTASDFSGPEWGQLKLVEVEHKMGQ